MISGEEDSDREAPGPVDPGQKILNSRPGPFSEVEQETKCRNSFQIRTEAAAAQAEDAAAQEVSGAQAAVAAQEASGAQAARAAPEAAAQAEAAAAIPRGIPDEAWQPCFFSLCLRLF